MQSSMSRDRLNEAIQEYSKYAYRELLQLASDPKAHVAYGILRGFFFVYTENYDDDDEFNLSLSDCRYIVRTVLSKVESAPSIFDRPDQTIVLCDSIETCLHCDSNAVGALLSTYQDHFDTNR